MKSGIFQQIFAYDLTCHDLMADVLGSNKKQCRKNGQDCLQIKFRCLKIRKCKKAASFTAVKSRIPQAAAAAYPAMIAIRIGITDKIHGTGSGQIQQHRV